MPKTKAPLPEGHHLDETGDFPRVVHTETGRVTTVLVNGKPVPHGEFAADLAKHYADAGVELPGPKEFAVTGATEAPSVEQMVEALRADGVDLESLVIQAGPGYFAHVAPGQPPLLVEEKTGVPKFKVVGGEVVPV